MSAVASVDACIAARRIAVSNRAIVVAVSAILFLPSILFAFALNPMPALCVVVGCVGAVAVISTSRPVSSGVLSRSVDWPQLLICLALALGLLLLGGETHLFYSNWDWLTRDAVLADIVAHGVRAGYRIGGIDYVLRAPVGLYMMPAIVGHAIGLLAAHLALLVQNGLFLGMTLYLLAQMGRGLAQLPILLLFAGASIVGLAIQSFNGLQQNGLPFWLMGGLDAWHPLYQYSGTLVQLFWVPNHALPGWWLATLLLLQVRGQVDIATVGVSVAGALLWSPLAIVPVAPWLLYCAARSPRAVLVARRTWLGAAASIGFLPILIYLVLASSSIEGRIALGESNFLLLYLVFVGVQLPVLWFLAKLAHVIPEADRPLVVVSGLTLLVLPFFYFGPTNDLVMRGSIASLAIIAFVFGSVVMTLTQRRERLALIGWGLVAISLPSAAVEFGRALATPRYAISDCSLIEAVQALGASGLPTNYIVLASAVPAWLMDTSAIPMSRAKQRRCWPDFIMPRYPGYMETIPNPR